MNLVTPTMIGELTALFADLRTDEAIRVVVFESANPDFFIGRGDLNLFLASRDTVPPKGTALNPLQTLLETLRTLPQATIAMLDGRAVGIGPEFLTSCDMAFASDTIVRHPIARDRSAVLETREGLREHFARFFATGVKLRATPITFIETVDPELAIGMSSYSWRKRVRDGPVRP